MSHSLVLACHLLAVLMWPVVGQSQASFDQYSLQGQASARIGNDYLQVTMVAERHSDAAADQIDADMDWARAQLDQFPTLEYKTENYSTWPVYRKDRISGWRSSQNLVFGGLDIALVRRAIESLEQRLQLRNLQFRPSAQSRRALEGELISRALENFRHRAQIVQLSMGAADYRVIHMNIDSGDHRAAALDAEGAKAGTAAGKTDGQSQLTVSVSGQIQLQP